jgi:hypothetical protein
MADPGFQAFQTQLDAVLSDPSMHSGNQLESVELTNR